MKILRLWIVLLALFILSPPTTSAQDCEDSPVAAAPTCRAPAGPPPQITTNVVFVVDVSGSMQFANRLPESIASFRSIAGQPCDEMNIKLIAFNDEVIVWQGLRYEEDDVPEGWTRLPSEEAVRRAQVWLSQFSGNRGTQPAPAIREALKALGTGQLAEEASVEMDALSVVLITDGEFQSEEVLKAIEDGQKARETPALLFALGVKVEERWRAGLKKIGEAGGGGFWWRED